MFNPKQQASLDRAKIVLEFALAIAGPMLAAEMSESAVLRSAEELADRSNERLVNRLNEDMTPEAVTMNLGETLLAQYGLKIQAIRALRDRTGLGLRESKDLVDQVHAVFTRPVL